MANSDQVQAAIKESLASEQFKAAVKELVSDSVNDTVGSQSFKVMLKDFVKEAVREFTQEEEFNQGLLTIMTDRVLPSDEWKLAIRPALREIIATELQPKGMIRTACDAGGVQSDEITQLAIEAMEASTSDGVLAGLQGQISEAVSLATSALSKLQLHIGASLALDEAVIKKYPWRAFEHEIPAEDLQLGWRKFLVDRDCMGNLAAGMAYASVASVVGMWAAHQDNSTLGKFTDAVALTKRAEDVTPAVARCAWKFWSTLALSNAKVS